MVEIKFSDCSELENLDLTTEQKVIYMLAEREIERERRRSEKWNSALVRLAKSAFETMLGVKQGDMVTLCYITPKKVIYDDVCMVRGELRVKCYHLKTDGRPRKNASCEQWRWFYDNNIKYQLNPK